MRDADVRRSLLADLSSQHDDDTLIIEEMGIANGRRRVDVAVVNGELTGHEIKSASDDLSRLGGQAEMYNAIFDRVWLVAADRHVAHAEVVVPEWWGLTAATLKDGGWVSLEPIRSAGQNASLKPVVLAQLLWRAEAIAFLREHELATPSLLRGSRRAMYRVIADATPLTLLRAHVRSVLKQREGWRD